MHTFGVRVRNSVPLQPLRMRVVLVLDAILGGRMSRRYKSSRGEGGAIRFNLTGQRKCLAAPVNSL
jgi:hypothetical protein